MSGGPKTMDSDPLLKAINANSASSSGSVSGEPASHRLGVFFYTAMTSTKRTKQPMVLNVTKIM